MKHGTVHESISQCFGRRLLNQLERSQLADRSTLEALIEVFFSIESAVTVEELVQELAQRGISSTHTQVSSILRQIVEYGLATAEEGTDRQPRYSHDEVDDHSDHLICLRCGADILFRNEALERIQQEIANDHGFRQFYHKHKIYGLCPECAAHEQHQLIPLRLLLPGETAIIEQMAGGAGMRERLSSMGLALGERVTVVSRSLMGQMVLQAGESRIAVGREFSNRVFVTMLNHGNCRGEIK